MLTLSQTWIDAFARGRVRPLWLITITTAPGVVYRFITGEQTRFGGAEAGPAVLGVLPPEGMGAKIDPLTRAMSIGSYELTFVDDGFVRALSSATVLKGKKVKIEIGEESLAEADFDLLVDNWLIDDLLPEPGRITVPIIDAFGFGTDDEISMFRWPDHPLAVAAEILGACTPADALNDASVDERLYDETSHFVISRHVQNDRPLPGPGRADAVGTGIGATTYQEINTVSPEDVRTKQRAFTMVRDLAWLAHGSILPGEVGQVRYAPIERDGAVHRHLTTDDVRAFKQISAYENIVNECAIVGRDKDGNTFPLFTARDTASQAAFGFPLNGGGTTPKIYRRSFPSDDQAHPWLNAFCRVPDQGHDGGGIYGVGNTVGLPNDTFGSAETQLTVSIPGYYGFCGTRLEDGSGVETVLTEPQTTAPTQQTIHKVSADRPVYLLLTNHAGNAEIVKTIDAIAWGTTQEKYTTTQLVTGPGGTGTKRFMTFGTYTGLVREQFGTTARNWTTDLRAGKLWVYDITIATWLTQQIVDRANYGIPEIEFDLGLRHHDLQHGDRVTLDAAVFLAYAIDGLDSTVVFEIVGKDPAITGYRFRAAKLRKGDTIDSVTLTPEDPDVPWSEVTGSL